MARKQLKKVAPKINKNEKPNEIEPRIESDEQYRCTCCGKKYTKQETNFNRSKSPLFHGNNGYLSVCRNCIAKLYEQYVKFYSGDEDAAAERICQITDMYFDPDVWAMSSKISESRNGKPRNRISTYVSKLNLAGVKGTTYSDTLIRNWEADIQHAETVKEVEENDDLTISADVVRRFGTGFTDGDYDALQIEYDSWIEREGAPIDKRQDELYISICYLKLNLQKLLQKGDANIGAAVVNYKAQIEAATTELEERRKKQEEAVKLDPIGLVYRDIEQFCPADYYRNQKMDKDFDHIGEYFNRYFLRPVRNLLTGSKEMDKEFNLSDSEE